MGLSSPGVGSNLDVKTIVQTLVNAAIVPKQNQLNKVTSSANTTLSDIGKLSSAFSSLQTSLSSLSDLSSLYSLKAVTSDSSYFNATINSQTAIKGTHQIEVQKLAQNQNLATDYVVDPNHLGTGTVSINFGTYNSDKSQFAVNAAATPLNITISSGNDSLSGVASAINNASSEVRASVVQDDKGSRLSITSTKTGETYAMQITGSLSALNYDPTTSNTPLIENVAAQNSLVKIDGITLSQNSNQLTNAISGVTLNLTKAALGTSTSLSIADDTTNLQDSVKDFVSKYNTAYNLLANLTKYDSSTKKAGSQQGDSQFRNLQQGLVGLLSTSVRNPNSPIQSLADIGITPDANGELQINQTKFDNVFANNYSNIGSIFAKSAYTTDSNATVLSVSSSVKSGSYSINLSQLTPGVSIAGTIGGLSASSSNGVNLTGSGDLAGLSINIFSGSTGSRGTVEVSDGLANKMSAFIDTYINATAGQFTQRTKLINNQLKDLSNEQDKITARSNALTSKYLAQFNALDVLMSKLNSTSSYLSQQLK
jgi:flagellar hook-associated protein 2